MSRDIILVPIQSLFSENILECSHTMNPEVGPRLRKWRSNFCISSFTTSIDEFQKAKLKKCVANHHKDMNYSTLSHGTSQSMNQMNSTASKNLISPIHVQLLLKINTEIHLNRNLYKLHIKKGRFTATIG